MSVEAMSWVWRHSRSKPTDRLVLLALADVASDDGEITAYSRSQSALVAKTGLDRRTVQRSLDRLVELGELVELRSGDGWQKTDYLMPMEGRQSAAPGAADDRPTGVTAPPPGRQSAAPITPSLSVLLPSSSVVRAPRSKTAMVEDWVPAPNTERWARDEGFSAEELHANVLSFRDHFIAKGERRADWEASFRNWLRNSRRFSPRPRPMSKLERNEAAKREFLATVGHQ